MRAALAIATMALTVLAAGCGGGGDDDDGQPDELTFCRLALVNQPVAEADAAVWRRLDELAPDEVDDPVTVLREAAEELEEHASRTRERIAAEFEVRFRPDYLAARAEIEAFLTEECAEYLPTTTSTSTSTTSTSTSTTTTTTDDEERDE